MGTDCHHQSDRWRQTDIFAIDILIVLMYIYRTTLKFAGALPACTFLKRLVYRNKRSNISFKREIPTCIWWLRAFINEVNAGLQLIIKETGLTINQVGDFWNKD